MQALPRRDFLKAILASAAVSGLGGCEKRASSDANIYDILEKYSLHGQHAEDVSIRAMKIANRDAMVTLTFGFGGCENYCPLTNRVLASLEGLKPDLKHVVIAVSGKDNLDQESRDKFHRDITRMGVNPANLTVLYPKNMSDASTIAEEEGAIVNAKNPLDHTALVALFGKDGKLIDAKSGLHDIEEFRRDWEGLLQQNRSK
jgi:cytochrome oxidase Cu insertion factor (SCO1/SenC/PrrC family)